MDTLGELGELGEVGVLDDRRTAGARMDNAAAKLPQDQSSDDMADETLMLRVQNGDKAAFRLLVARHIDRIVGTARRIVGSEAEDIAQDVFLKVWTSSDQWKPGQARFRTWLYRVAVNRCIDVTRRSHTSSVEEIPEIVDDSPSPYAQCLQQQEATRLRAAMEGISDQQRTAITLYYHESLTAAEVAEIMGIKLNAVESLLKRGRQKLRTILK